MALYLVRLRLSASPVYLVALRAQLGQQLVHEHHLAGRLHQLLHLRQPLPRHALLVEHMVLEAPAQELHT